MPLLSCPVLPPPVLSFPEVGESTKVAAVFHEHGQGILVLTLWRS
jgi:hypothetical protein